MYFQKKIITFLIFLFFFLTKADDMNKFNLISPEKEWQFISDQVMGGVSFGKKELLFEDKKQYLRMTGFVSLDNNGGFIQVRHKLIDKVRSANGIKINARGNNKKYRIHIRTKFTLLPWQYYSATFNVNKNWEIIKIDFNEFIRSGTLLPKTFNVGHINSLAVVAYGEEYKVRIDLSELNFY